MLTTETVAEVEQSEMPSFNHSYICAQIMRQLLPQPGIEPLPELTLAIGNGLTPDISIYPSDQIKPNFRRDVIRYEHLPLVAIEVISSSQTIKDLLDKADAYINAGVKVIWTVEPYTHMVFVTTAQGEQRILDDKVEYNGIVVDFAKIFGGGELAA